MRKSIGAFALTALTTLATGAAGAGATKPSFGRTGRVSGSIATVAELNGDGNVDLALVTPGRIDERDHNLVVVPARITALLGDGRGGFAPAQGPALATDGLTSAVASGDFDGDGNVDLVAANRLPTCPLDGCDEIPAVNSVQVALGDGSGGLRANAASPARLPGRPETPVAADVNADGKLDLLVSIEVEPRTWRIMLLLGDGRGGLTAASSFTGSPAFAVGDLDGDKKPDLVRSGTNTVTVLLGDGTGAFRTVGSPVPVGRYTEAIAIGDFNRDGKHDVVRVGGSTTVLLGDGAGGLRAAPGSPHKVGGYSVAIADLTGDGNVDLAVGDFDKLTILRGDGAGGFRPAGSLDSEGGALHAAAELNGDGRTDLVADHQLLLQTPSVPNAALRRLSQQPPRAVFATRGPIGTLAADGSQAAVRAWNPRGLKIVVWNARRGRSTSLPETWTGGARDCDADCGSLLALAGGQVGSIAASGGNTLELHLLVAKLPAGRLKDRDTADSNGDGEGTWITNVLGAGPLLAYNRWSVSCSPGSDDFGLGCDWGRKMSEKEVVRVVAGRPVVVARGALQAVGGGRMAVETEGAVNVLRPNGSRVASIPVGGIPPRAVALGAAWLAVQAPLTLDLYDPTTAKKVRSLPLGPSATLKLAGVTTRLALLRGQGRLVVVRLSDGRLMQVSRTGLVDAKLTEAGLFYAYNERTATLKGRIVFEPTAAVLSRFARAG